jgi:hypothetical protein
MADRKDGCCNSTTILVANTGKSSEILCISCAELELELKKTQIELRSTEKIVELLQDELYSVKLEVSSSQGKGEE